MVFSAFNIICTRGLQVKTGNPEIVLQAITNHTLKGLVRYKKGTTPAATEPGLAHIMDDAGEMDKPLWQGIMYSLNTACPEDI